MKKYLLIFIFFISSSFVYAVDWQPQSDDLEVDVDSIIKVRRSVTAWVKDYNHGQYKIRNFRRVAFVLHHNTAICNENKLKNLYVAYYDRKGRLIDSETIENIHHLPIVPYTFEEKVFNTLCSYL